MQKKFTDEYVLTAIFFCFFLILTPLGIFNDWVPPEIHKGFYSVTQIDQGDDTGYYAFLRSMFFDGDIDFFNEKNMPILTTSLLLVFLITIGKLGKESYFYLFS